MPVGCNVGYGHLERLESGAWVQIEAADARRGDTVRMFEMATGPGEPYIVTETGADIAATTRAFLALPTVPPSLPRDAD